MGRRGGEVVWGGEEVRWFGEERRWFGEERRWYGEERRRYGDEQERERKEMSWAEQVDLAYPLEECEFRMQIEKELDVVDGMF